MASNTPTSDHPSVSSGPTIALTGAGSRSTGDAAAAAGEAGGAAADHEEAQAFGTGHEAVLDTRGDDRHVVGLELLAVDRAAAVQHHEDLGVVVAVGGRVEVGRDL